MWLRRFELRLKSEDGSLKRTITELRIDFKSKEHFAINGLTNMADWCDISIFNLSKDSFKAIATTDTVHVELLFGYSDSDMQLVFDGVVRDVVGERVLPNHITTLYCIPKGRFNAEKPITYSGTREDTFESIANNIAGQLGMTLEFVGVDDAIRKQKHYNIEINDFGSKALVNLCKQYSCVPRIRGTSIVVLYEPHAGTISKVPEQHALKTELLRGTPVAGVATMDIPYALNTSIGAGDVINVSAFSETKSGQNNLANGVVSVSGVAPAALHYAEEVNSWALSDKYQVVSVFHEGSNYTDVAKSHLTCKFYVDSNKGRYS